MRHSKFIRNFSGKTLAISLLALVAGSTAQAAAVFENFSTSSSTGLTNGTTIGSAFTTGNTAISLSSVVFPQFNTSSSTDLFTAGEMCFINLRNADGTVGAVLFSNFSVSDGGIQYSGQTEADVNTPFTLLPNTSYYFSVTAPSSTSWNFTSGTTYNSPYGFTAPATGNASYKVVGVTTSYFTLAQGPQLIYIDGTPVVPEPSSLCLLGLAGAGAVVMVRRARSAKVA